MKHLLLTTITAVLLVGCGESQQSAPAPEAKPVEPVAEVAQPEPSVAKAQSIPIHQAAMQGNIEAVKQYLAAGKDVNAKDSFGRTLLHWTADRGHQEIVEFLIANNADVNTQDMSGNTPLSLARNWSRNEIVEILGKHGGKILIWEAIQEGSLKAVKQHFNSGIDVNVKVSKRGRSSQSWHPLNWAAANGQIKIVEFLLSRGAEVNSKDGVGYIALHYAAGRGSYKEVVEVLIANGEDVNTKAVDGSTPLDLAAMAQNKGIMDLIRKHSGKHGTFFGAVSGGDIEAVKKFLVAGTDANKKWRGNAPLMAAAASGHNETVELLISEGAEVNAIKRDAMDRNLTALDIAEQKGNKDTAALLRKHGGKPGKELKGDNNDLASKNGVEYDSMVEVDLSSFTEEQRTTILARANKEGCDCGCNMTVAKCRNVDLSCKRSVALANAIVKGVGGEKPKN